MRRQLRVAPLMVVLAAVAGGMASALCAQPPNAGDYSAAEHELVEFRNEMVPMRDGVKLAIDIFRPEGEGRFPVVLSQIPYNKNGGAGRARWLAARGYAVVNADVRGRYASEGNWDPCDPKRKTDGYDLVEWLGSQPWLTGKVGTWGLSYMGWTQWWTASQAPPSLVAIVPEVAPPDQFRNLPYQEGILVSVMLDWACTNQGSGNIVVGSGGYGGFPATRYEDMMHTPYIDLLNYRKVNKGSPWFETWIPGQPIDVSGVLEEASRTNPGRAARRSRAGLDNAGTAGADFSGTPMNYLGMKQYGLRDCRGPARPRMVVGPWSHTGRGRSLVRFDYGRRPRSTGTGTLPVVRLSPQGRQRRARQAARPPVHHGGLTSGPGGERLAYRNKMDSSTYTAAARPFVSLATAR